MARRSPPPSPEDPTDPSTQGAKAPQPKASRSRGSRGTRYRTGSSYPGPDGDDTDGAAAVSPVEDRDIYGEDDPLPGDEESNSGTEVDEGPAAEPDGTRLGPPCKLVVLAGPDKGKVKRFSGVRMVVGRTEGCAIYLTDTSVSRRHLELVLGSTGVLLRDLGSGNGTRVNGQPFTEGLLKHLDIIEIGQSQLQFVDENEAKRLAAEGEKRQREETEKQKAEADKKPEAPAGPNPSELKTDPKTDGAAGDHWLEQTHFSAAKAELRNALRGLDRRQKVVAGVVAGLSLLLTFVLLPVMLRPAGPLPIEPREAMAKKKLEQAQVALSEGRYTEALDFLESAERLRPGIDKAGVGARVRTEVDARKGLETARSMLRQQKFDEAWSAVAAVPEANDQIRREKELLMSELDARQNDYWAKAAEDALQKRDLEGAKEILKNHLSQDKQEAFRPKLAQAQAELNRREKVEREREAAERESTRRRAEVVRESEVESVFRGVERKFHAQDFERATLECSRVMDTHSEPDIRNRALQLKRLIPQFGRNWADGEHKFNSGALESASAALKRAKELYDQIALPGMLGAQLDDHLLQATLAAGKAALAREDLVSAATLFKDALRQNPDEVEAKAGLARIARQADDLWWKGYEERDRNPKAAIEKFKLILEVAPKSSQPYHRAKEALHQMQH